MNIKEEAIQYYKEFVEEDKRRRNNKNLDEYNFSKEKNKLLEKLQQDTNLALLKLEEHEHDILFTHKDHLKQIRSFNYHKEFQDKYLEAKENIISLYDYIASVQKSTHGLAFQIEKYIKKLKPRHLFNDQPESYYSTIMSEIQKAVEQINQSETIDGDVEALKVIAQGVIDITFVSDFSEALLDNHHIPQDIQKEKETIENESYQKLLDEAKKKREKEEEKLKSKQEEVYAYLKEKEKNIKETHKNVGKIETYDVYPRLIHVKEAFDFETKSKEKNFVGTIDFQSGREEIRFSIATSYSNDFTSEQLQFYQNLFGIDLNQIATSFEYLTLNDTNSTLLVETPGYDESEALQEALGEFFSNIQFQILSHFPKNKVKFVYIDCSERIDSPIPSLKYRLDNEETGRLFKDSILSLNGVDIFEKPGEIERVLEYIIGMVRNTRAPKYKAAGGYFRYNKKSKNEISEYYVVFINGYSSKLEDMSHKKNSENIAQLIQTAKSCGIYFVINQYIESSQYNMDVKKITSSDIPMHILTDIQPKKKTAILDGKQINFNIRKNDFDEDEFLMQIKSTIEEENKKETQLQKEQQLAKEKEEEKKQNVYLLDLLKEEERKNPRHGPFVSEMKIPVGIDKNGKTTYFTTNTKYVHSLIVGASGTGKSSFLHTLILSASYLYSPEEVEFYISDFKADAVNTEFLNYKYGNSMYVPHVKFLSLSNSEENLSSIFEKIRSIFNERLDQFKKTSQTNVATNIEEYNKSELVLQGKLPRMPRLFFIIDEYNWMFKDSINKSISDIKKELTELLETIRVSGICILLAGQHYVSNLGSLHNKIVYRMSTSSEMESSLGEVGSKCHLQDLSYYKNFNALCYGPETADHFDSKNTTRIAFTGFNKPDGKNVKVNIDDEKFVGTLIHEINRRYPNYSKKQFVAGEVSSVSIMDDYKTILELYEKMEHDISLSNTIPLFLGESYNDSKPIMIPLSMKERSSLFVEAEANKVDLIEKNIILSFLTYLKNNRGVDPTNIYYSWIRKGAQDMNRVAGIEELRKKYPSSFGNKLKMTYDDKETASMIQKVYEIYKERKISSKKKDLTLYRYPILFVLHNINWLNEEDEPIQIVKKEEHIDTIDDQVSQKYGAKFGDLFGSISKTDVTKIEIVKNKDAKSMLRTLYVDGCDEGIFVVISSTDSSLEKCQEVMDDRLDMSRGIFGSYDICKACSATIRSNSNIDFTNDYKNPSCGFITPKNYKIRLYEYETEEKEFFEKLK